MGKITVLKTEAKSNKELEVFVQDESGKHFCYRYETGIRSNELEFLNRYHYDPQTNRRTYDLRKGLLNEKDLEIANTLLNENQSKG